MSRWPPHTHTHTRDGPQWNISGGEPVKSTLFNQKHGSTKQTPTNPTTVKTKKKIKVKIKKLKRSQYGHTPTHLKVAVEKIVTVASTHTREVPVERVVERVVTVPQLTEREVPVTTIVERVVEVPVGLAERVVATTVTHTIEVPVERACGNV